MLEILVAVAILGVLVALGIAGYQRVVEMGMGAKNLSNHRTIIRGLLAYAGEHNGVLPWGNDLDEPRYPYPKTLFRQGYVTDGSVFFSPRFWPFWANSEGALLVLRNPDKYHNSVIPWAYPSYAANRYGAMPTSADGRVRANLARVGGDGNLSKLMLIRDVYHETHAEKYGGGNWWFSNEGTIPKMEDCYSGIVHASFADGHVEGIKREDMVKMMKSGSAPPMFINVYTSD